jgi:hypothetical protein
MYIEHIEGNNANENRTTGEEQIAANTGSGQLPKNGGQHHGKLHAL